MATLEIVDYLTDQRPLRRKARPVRQEEIHTDAFCQFVHDLSQTMAAHNALGLAATQVLPTAPDGEPWAVFVLRDPMTQQPRVIVNPEIISTADHTWAKDGCLSFRSVHWACKYPNLLRARALDDEFHPLNVGLNGQHARGFQHEMDHLSGICMIDAMTSNDRQRFLAKVAKAKR